ncbi:hypothetical protein H0H92_010720 [Tricholoma furcatifolium]|nr:hypothetical protein H0H92_010720 [Tricholoma furcatifolium]
MIKLISCIAAFFALASPTISTPVDQSPYFVRHPEAVPHEYIVKVRDGATKHAVLIATNVTTLLNDWHPEFNLFIGKFDSDQLSALQFNPYIEYIEENGIARADMPTTVNAGHFEHEPDNDDPVVNATEPWIVQNNAYWGLSRISHKGKVSGDNPRHTLKEFEGRARWGESFTGTHGRDVFGHGTKVRFILLKEHISGVLAGKRYGVAKHAKLIAVKVTDDEGECLLIRNELVPTDFFGS